MDQRLLTALENLGNALEEIASALQSKEESKSSTVEAMKGGDFGKQLESINAQLKSIKADTQALLKQQKTIPAMSKEKEKGGKSDTDGFKNPMAEIGADKKKESAILKGLGVILLIAVAVLAIGMAFKLVGKIDFLSVIALASAIFLISLSFEKVASLKLSLKDALVSSAALVMMAAAVTISSWILKKIVPVGILQTVTGILIATMFTVMAPKLENIFIAASIAAKLRVKRSTLLTTLVSISAAIALSSWVLTKIVLMSPLQAITAILIAGMFTVISVNFDKIAFGVSLFKRFKLGKLILLTTLTSIAAAITASSWILQGVVPIGLAKAITAILISAMFLVITLNFQKIATGVAAFQRLQISKLALVLTLVGIATAITLSSHILAKTQPIGLMQFITALGVAILFAIMSYIMPELAAGVFVIDKALGKVGVLMIPVIFVALALAIMLSSHILAETASLNLAKILQIVVFGLALALVVFAMMPSVLAVGIAAASGVGAGAILLGVVLIPLIAGAIALSSHALSMGKYAIYPGLGWAASVGILMTVFSLAVLGLGIIAVTGVGLVAILLGASLVPVIANTIVKTDETIAKGKYDKFPGWRWIASVGATMTGFGLAVLTLGLLAVTGVGYVAILLGASLVPKVAQAIVDTDEIIAKGKYQKQPGFRWIASVALSMTLFGAAVVALGAIAVTGIGAVALWAGTEFVPMIAKTIVAADKEIAKGRYSKYPGIEWAASVGSLMTVFGLAVLTLGSFVVGTFGFGKAALNAGRSAVKLIAQSVVDVAWIFNKNNAAFKFGPSKDWAEGVAIALGAFSPVYSMLVRGGIMKAIFGTSVTPTQFSEAIKVISQGIVDAAWFFQGAEAAFVGGPKKEWSEGVGKAIGAFAPVYKILADQKGFFGTGVSIWEVKKAVKAISWGIVASAKIFSANSAPFEKYPSKQWASGVSSSLKAFSPIIKMLMSDSLFVSGASKIRTLIAGIKGISSAIVYTAKTLSSVKDWQAMSKTGVPTRLWSYRVKIALQSMSRTARTLKANGKELYMVQRTAYAIAATANIFRSARKAFSENLSSDVRRWGDRLLSKNGIFNQFVNMAKWLKQQEKSMEAGGALAAVGEGLLAAANPIGFIAMKMTGPSSKSTGDPVADTALKIVRVARILHQNKKFFQLNIDPNFMKKVGKNILDFNFIVQKLAESEGSKGFLASVGDSINSMFGNDPISKIARRMVTLAGAYDKLASALIKLGGAMRMLNISDARRLGGITAGIASGQSSEEPEARRREVTPVRTEIGRVREPGAGRGKSNHEVNQMNMIKKLDQIVKILKNIDRSVASVDDFISDQSEGKYPAAGGGKLF